MVSSIRSNTLPNFKKLTIINSKRIEIWDYEQQSDIITQLSYLTLQYFASVILLIKTLRHINSILPDYCTYEIQLAHVAS